MHLSFSGIYYIDMLSQGQREYRDWRGCCDREEGKQGDFCHRGNVNIGIEGTLVTEKQGIEENSVTETT